jgi:hypothetical protein
MWAFVCGKHFEWEKLTQSTFNFVGNQSFHSAPLLKSYINFSPLLQMKLMKGRVRIVLILGVGLKICGINYVTQHFEIIK